MVENFDKFFWSRVKNEKYFDNGLDAIKQIIVFHEVCDLVGGATTVKTTYGDAFIKRNDFLCVLTVCYSRASIVPSLWVCAPENDNLWKEFVNELHREPEDVATIEFYKQKLKIEIPRRLIEEIKKALI